MNLYIYQFISKWMIKTLQNGNLPFYIELKDISTMILLPFYCNDTQLTLYQLNEMINLSFSFDKFTVFD